MQALYEDLINKDGFYVTYTIPGDYAQQATAYGVFFTARNPCEVSWVGVRYTVANGAALTLDVVQVDNGEAVAAGATMLASTFDLNTTVDTLQTRTKFTLAKTGTTRLLENQSIGLIKTGTLTSISHLSITVYLKPLGKGDYR